MYSFSGKLWVKDGNNHILYHCPFHEPEELATIFLDEELNLCYTNIG